MVPSHHHQWKSWVFSICCSAQAPANANRIDDDNMLACLHHLFHQDQSGVRFSHAPLCQDRKGLCDGLNRNGEVGRDAQSIHSTSIVRQRCDPCRSPFSMTHHLLFLSVLFSSVLFSARETVALRRLARHVLGRSVLAVLKCICRHVALSSPSVGGYFRLPDQHRAAPPFGVGFWDCREIPSGGTLLRQSFQKEDLRFRQDRKS